MNHIEGDSKEASSVTNVEELDGGFKLRSGMTLMTLKLGRPLPISGQNIQSPPTLNFLHLSNSTSIHFLFEIPTTISLPDTGGAIEIVCKKGVNAPNQTAPLPRIQVRCRLRPHCHSHTQPSKPRRAPKTWSFSILSPFFV